MLRLFLETIGKLFLVAFQEPSGANPVLIFDMLLEKNRPENQEVFQAGDVLHLWILRGNMGDDYVNNPDGAKAMSRAIVPLFVPAAMIWSEVK